MLLCSFHRNTQLCALMKKLVPRSTVEITNTVSVQEPVFVVGRVVVQQLETKVRLEIQSRNIAKLISASWRN